MCPVCRGDVLQPLLRRHREGASHEGGGRPGRAVWSGLRPLRRALQSAEPLQGPSCVGPPRPDRPRPLQGAHAGEAGLVWGEHLSWEPLQLKLCSVQREDGFLRALCARRAACPRLPPAPQPSDGGGTWLLQLWPSLGRRGSRVSVVSGALSLPCSRMH